MGKKLLIVLTACIFGSLFFVSSGHAAMCGNGICGDYLAGGEFENPANCPEDCVCGDVNGSGEVDISDLTYFVDYMFMDGPAPVPNGAAGDLNGDGDVNISDLTILTDWMFNGGPQPTCGACIVNGVCNVAFGEDPQSCPDDCDACTYACLEAYGAEGFTPPDGSYNTQCAPLELCQGRIYKYWQYCAAHEGDELCDEGSVCCCAYTQPEPGCEYTECALNGDDCSIRECCNSWDTCVPETQTCENLCVGQSESCLHNPCCDGLTCENFGGDYVCLPDQDPCGNGWCETWLGEDPYNCPQDCPSCIPVDPCNGSVCSDYGVLYDDGCGNPISCSCEGTDICQPHDGTCLPEQPPIDGGWCEWSSCSAECDGGTQTRLCGCPAPANGGTSCVGGTIQICNTEPCCEPNECSDLTLGLEGQPCGILDDGCGGSTINCPCRLGACADYDGNGDYVCEICNYDGICDISDGEDPTNCPQDCGNLPSCGNEQCETWLGEDPTNCPDDCGFCGDGNCAPSEELNCSQDCPGAPDCSNIDCSVLGELECCSECCSGFYAPEGFCYCAETDISCYMPIESCPDKTSVEPTVEPIGKVLPPNMR